LSSRADDLLTELRNNWQKIQLFRASQTPTSDDVIKIKLVMQDINSNLIQLYGALTGLSGFNQASLSAPLANSVVNTISGMNNILALMTDDKSANKMFNLGIALFNINIDSLITIFERLFERKGA